jgi:aconitate hydratase
VLAESFERIHRSNLVGMGVLPLVFKDGVTRTSLGLKGDETIDVKGLDDLKPGMDIEVVIHRADGSSETITAKSRLDTQDEVAYYRNGGILHYVLRGMAKAA